MSSLAYVDYLNERDLLEIHTARSVQQLGDVVLESLRHAMKENDDRMIFQAMIDIGNVEGARNVQIIDVEGRVYASSDTSSVGTVRQRDDVGCDECHSLPSEERTRTFQLSTADGILRITTPILNEPDCATCHKESGTHLGMLLFDMSVADLDQQLKGDLRAGLLSAIAGSLVVTLGAYLLMHWMVVRRVEVFRTPLAMLAAGDFSARVPIPAQPSDELDDLAESFNKMASDLEQHSRAERERTNVREHAIVEERRRIARELHDGLSQLLGYVNTKAIATRLLLQNKKTEDAEQQLSELEDATREVFIDVREAILGLHLASKIGGGLANSLREYTTQFSRLTSIPVGLDIHPEFESRSLPAETELQLLRIVQEALTNIRKHASASQAWVSMNLENRSMILSIRDNGLGFDPEASPPDDELKFGLDTMSERAEAIGAEFRLDSSSGNGTHVVVKLRNQEG
jgi:signal transduction histidine kinase